MHFLPDAAEDAEDLGIENYPTAYLFAAVGFFLVFFVQKVLSPLLSPALPQSPEAPEPAEEAPHGGCCSQGAEVVLGKVTALTGSGSGCMLCINAMSRPIS